MTELVINALKHAFLNDMFGKIIVDYRSAGPEWALKVSDDGVGMGTIPPQAGLGSSIVNALAQHLRPNVVVTGGNPGTTVSLVIFPMPNPPSGSDGPKSRCRAAFFALAPPILLLADFKQLVQVVDRHASV